ncbi:M50 family metallopeptidase|uniref:Stage IV sporulation protein FB n=1 Tax=Dendrosporobacter quercicolus TaxID=146817 RepID=A0A1G9N076_9FIRM|nr:M50 family metallopeptidase [Dendrosporobacter quercicolus]NSL47193.1 M50 family metallopeptidase [Dendrosporobacter quercicolus DSM 1736]SDL79966.1 stage IV sporulation protein FB [Dendrosporobacter quercicolus]
MRVGKVRNTQFILNNWFLVLIAIFAVAGMAQKVLLVFGSVLWHEFAHAVAALALGYKVREIELLPFGGVARIDRLGEASAKSEILMAAAGPAASMVLAAAIYLTIDLTPANEYWQFFYEINLMLALFNLIPALPLDGGRILRAVLALQCGYGKATLVVANMSRAVSGGLMVKVLYDYWFFQLLNLSLIIAAFFLYVAAKAELKVAGYRTMRILANKKADLCSRGYMPTTHYTAMANASVRDVVKLFEPERYHIILIVDESYRIRGSLTETEVWEALPVRGLYAKMGDFL